MKREGRTIDDPSRARDDLKRWGLYELFSEMQRGVYHVTGPRGLADIRSSREILPSSPNRAFSQCSTAGSYALKHRYVSLFDFERRTEDVCLEYSFQWCGFLTLFKPLNVILEVNRDRLPQPLVTYEDAMKEGYGTVKFPFVECWHPEPIPWSAVTSCLLVWSNRGTPPQWERHSIGEEFLGWYDEVVAPVMESLPQREPDLDL